MEKEKWSKDYKKFVLFVAGFLILIIGITLILVCWKDVVAFFRGFTGIVLAIGGLFMMYAVGKTQ